MNTSFSTTASAALLDQLAEESRRVLSDWRGLVLLRRATLSLSPAGRRWEKLPRERSDLTPLFRQMQRRGEIRPISSHLHLYEVIVAYARQGFLDEREVLFECHPYAALSHRSALDFHGLTGDLPKELTVTISADTHGGLLPIGTRPADWEGISQPIARTPAKILGRPVKWIRTKPEWFFGFADFEPLGYPIRYTTLERTLLDGLQHPELSGGIENVLRAWTQACDRIDVDALVYAVDRLDIAVLRQRAGFVLEQVGLNHQILDRWQQQSKRGGSSRLVGSEPFASRYDGRWNLSLNGPVDLLRENER